MKTFFKVFGLVLLYLTVYFVISNNLAGIVYLAALFIDIFRNPEVLSNGVFQAHLMKLNDMIIAGSLLIQMGAAVLSFFIYWFISWIKKRKFSEEISLYRTSTSNIVISSILGISLLLPVSVMVGLLGIDKFSPDTEKMMEAIMGNSNIIVLYLGIGLIAPIIEEIIFRGLIQTELKKHMPIAVAIVIQGLLFGVYHLNITQAIYASVLGIVLGYVCYKTGSLLASILVHVFFNTTSLVIENIASNFDLLNSDKLANPGQAVFAASSVLFLFLSVAMIIVCFTLLSINNRKNEPTTMPLD